MHRRQMRYASDLHRSRTARPSCHDRNDAHAARALLLVLTIALAVFAIGGALTAFDLATRATRTTASAADHAGPDSLDDASPEDNASTPASQWERGSTPYLYQRDPAWKDVPYAGETIGTSGCGPTCLSMVYIALTGRTDRSPEAMCAFSERGGYVEDGMTRWALLDEGASQLGLSSSIIAAAPSAIEAELAQGHPLMLSLREGDFTSVGHFIVACGLADNGKLVIRDPNSPVRSHTTWDIQRVLDQARSVWAFSAD